MRSIRVPKNIYDESKQLKRYIFREQGLNMPLWKAVVAIENGKNKRKGGGDIWF